MKKLNISLWKLGVFLCFFIAFEDLLFSHDKNLNINFGQTLVNIVETCTKTGVGVAHRKDGNLVLLTDISSTINGIFPTQILFSFNKYNKLMMIGYFFATLNKQELALANIAPFPVAFKDGYGANYNSQYIVNLSPQSGSYLISVINREMFRDHDSQSEEELIKDIDKNYFRRNRPLENTVALILPGESLEKIKWKVSKYAAEYEILPNGDMRIYHFGKTILSGWVHECYILLGKNQEAEKVFYEFRDENEGVLFASEIPMIKKDAVQVKLLRSDIKLAATLQNNTFVLASPKSGQYRIVFLDILAIQKNDPQGYEEVLQTLDRVKKHLESQAQ